MSPGKMMRWIEPNRRPEAKLLFALSPAFDESRPEGHTMQVISGVYAVWCTVTKKCYVGRSSRIRSRWGDERRLLRLHVVQKKLQRAWDRFGEDAIDFEEIESVPMQQGESKDDFDKRLKARE